ncbi:MAG: aminotransferase class V-fold PLP-dependent enzyme [Candidatus Cloacimonetes bacterium]|nr:aminotransferase class V-fold PLP-dependent enzyme [Candidatus Cloacimonadota bacterium]
MKFDPALEIQNFLVFGEFGDVNPSICDSSTYTFLQANTMEGVFEGDIEGCFLYSRQWNPTSRYLCQALSRMEGGEDAQVFASGMAAISSTILELCSAGDEIICGRTVYGGTYALLANLLPRFGIKTHFVDLSDESEIEEKISPSTRLIYTESVSNPLLEVMDLPKLARLCQKRSLKLVVDNTFCPMILSPLRLGADIVVYSMTKFINGASDCIAGAAVGKKDFIKSLVDVNQGVGMLMGPVLDGFRAAGILKNLHTLHCRMQKHSENALILANYLEKTGLKVFYPGLTSHAGHSLLGELMNCGYGYGGVLTVDLGTKANANKFMIQMQEEKVGYLAVSLGYFKTLFSAPGHSTSSEIPESERVKMGINDALVRISVGLDRNMHETWKLIEKCLP